MKPLHPVVRAIICVGVASSAPACKGKVNYVEPARRWRWRHLREPSRARIDRHHLLQRRDLHL
jgi:hypothetical protein